LPIGGVEHFAPVFDLDYMVGDQANAGAFGPAFNALVAIPSFDDR
jgi:hypothetical protein